MYEKLWEHILYEGFDKLANSEEVTLYDPDNATFLHCKVNLDLWILWIPSKIKQKKEEEVHSDFL